MMDTRAPASAGRDLVTTQKRMLEISCELNSTADLDTLLSIIMDAATELTGAEAASVLLLNPRTRDLYFAATSHGSRPGLIGMTVPLDSSIAGAVLLTEQPHIVSDVRQDPRHHREVGEKIDYEIRSLLGVPMLAEEHRVGVLEAINKNEGQFSQDDVETLTTLANLAAIAIHKAGLIAQLRDANEQLSELDRLKSDFISVASHELRTPLAVILGYVNLLKDQVASGELDLILEAALQLRGLMESMLNLGYIDAGQSKLNLSRFGLPALVREVVDEQGKLIEAKEQKVQLFLPRESCTVVADRESVRLVLTNLISNAIKFTPAGGRIQLAVTRRSDEIWTSVSDNGPGIPASYQKRVFTRFFQVEPHLTRQHGGMGLGLAIAKELLELQNGRIWLESTEGAGSTFTFALPLAKGATLEE
jgi:signal transduction histidine kinase